MSTLYYSNHLLLTTNQALSLCCCGSGLYWEAIPCDMAITPKNALCADWEQCQLSNRIFVNMLSRCDGVVNKVCECQQIRFESSGMKTSNTSNIINILYAGGNFPSTIVIDETTLTLTEPTAGSSGLNLIGKTIADVEAFINNYPSSNWGVSSVNLNTANAATIISTGTLTYSSAGTQSFGTRNSRINFEWDGAITPYANFSTDLNTFGSNLQSALASGIGSGILVTRNVPLSNSLGKLIYDITFSGDLCGIKQPFITTYVESIVPNNSSINAKSSWKYGQWASGDTYLGSHPNYYVTGSGGNCPYEDITTWPGGPAYFDESISCCPQRGVSIGPNQTLGWENVYPTGISGYAYEGPNGTLIDGLPWANLDRTVKINQECYQLSPNYFVFGQQGRLEYDYHTDRPLYVKAGCDFGSSNNCDNSGVPRNCVVELFIPQFHQNVPWGPFGSYYKGIESDVHLAYKSPFNQTYSPAGGISWLSANAPGEIASERLGWDYRPSGYIKTKGTWLETKEIEVKFAVRRPIPFYVGTAEWDDKPYFIEVTGNLNLFTSGYYGPLGTGCDVFTVIFDCSGKTVGDFLDAINSLTVQHYGCQIFSFCAGSNDARGIPADKIINTSSEIFEQVIDAYFTTDQGPITDSDIWSGSDIIVGPKPYTHLFEGSIDNPDRPYIDVYANNPTNSTVIAKTPPVCRIFDEDLPREEPYGTSLYSRGNSMWFTNIPVTKKNVIQIAQNTGFIDFSYLTIGVSNKYINYAGSGVGFFSSGFINTNKQGSGYTIGDCITDLNAITWVSGITPFNPFVASTGSDVEYPVWLDDQTSVNGSTYFYGTGIYETRYNFSYKEPLIDTATTDLTRGSTNLEAYVRRRCHYTLDGGTTYKDLQQNFCVPPNNRDLGADALLDCAGDRVVENGWLISYGCTSFNCKTTYYHACRRCPCDKVYRCSDGIGRYFPHPFNQEGGNLDNQEYWQAFYTPDADFAVNQPILYICEHNLHPDCDIPMLVKVPFMIVYVNNPTAGPLFQFGQDNLLPGQEEFCKPSNSLISNQYGWCQYLDPSWPKIREEDIPRTRPVTSYIAQRGLGVFCSTNPWNYDPRIVQRGTIDTLLLPQGSALHGLPLGCLEPPNGIDCSLGACLSCDNWDSIQNIGLVYPEYYDYLPVVDPSAPDSYFVLKALFRPVLSNPTTEGDICGGTICNRIDVDCGTACCECGFAAEVNGTGCCFSQRVAHPFSQTSTYIYFSQIDSTRVNCNFSPVAGRDPSCESRFFIVGQCGAPDSCSQPGVSCCTSPLCWGGSVSNSLNIVLTKTVTTCGCSINGGTGVCFSDNPSLTSSCAGTFCSDCMEWTNFPTPTKTTYCYDCQGWISYLPYATGTYSTGGCILECFGNGDSCSPRSVQFTEDCGGSGSYTFTKNINACGYGTYNYNSSKVSSGVVSYDACTATSYEWDADCFTAIGAEDQNPVWGTCVTSLPTNGKTYSYITTWANSVATFNCGYKNVGYASGIESIDSRFLGKEGCYT